MTDRKRLANNGMVRRDQRERMVEKGAVFLCLDCGPDDSGKSIRLGIEDVLGDNQSGFFHKGRIGHRVTVTYALGRAEVEDAQR